MRTRWSLVNGIVFVCVAGLLASSQVSAGGQRLLAGLLLAAPWAASGVTTWRWPRIGAWLGLAVATASLALAVWIGSMAIAGEGREIAEQLFASPEGHFSWAGVLYTTIAYGIAFVASIGLSLGLLVEARKDRIGRSPQSSDGGTARSSHASLDSR